MTPAAIAKKRLTNIYDGQLPGGSSNPTGTNHSSTDDPPFFFNWPRWVVYLVCIVGSWGVVCGLVVGIWCMVTLSGCECDQACKDGYAAWLKQKEKACESLDTTSFYYEKDFCAAYWNKELVKQGRMPEARK